MVLRLRHCRFLFRTHIGISRRDLVQRDLFQRGASEQRKSFSLLLGWLFRGWFFLIEWNGMMNLSKNSDQMMLVVVGRGQEVVLLCYSSVFQEKHCSFSG